MFDRINEPDWKIFKPLRELALERYCERALAEVARIGADGAKSHHQRYVETYRLLEERDKELGRVFDYLRRSTALAQVAAFRALALITDEEFTRFSQETRDIVDFILKPR